MTENQLLIERLCKEGKTVSEITKVSGLNESYVRRYLQRAGLIPPPATNKLRTYGWSMNDERSFIKRLGTHSEGMITPKMELLKKYRAVCEMRENINGLKTEEVIKYIDKQIEEERKLRCC